MHKQRLMIVGAAALGLVSVFLPWFSISFMGFKMQLSGLAGEVWGGYVFLGLAIAAAAMALTQGDKSQELDADAKKKVMGMAGGALGFMLYFILVKLTLSATGIGAWLALLAAIAMLAAPFVIKGDGGFEMPNKDTIKADLDDSKKDVE